MLHRCFLFLVVASLAVSSSTASATSVFYDMSATASYEQAWPTGVSQTGGVIMNGYSSAQSNYYTPWAFPAGTAGGTMTNASSGFTASGGTIYRMVSSSMSNNGNVTANETSIAHVGWAVTGNAGNLASASYANFQYGTNNTRSNAINDNGDVGG